MEEKIYSEIEIADKVSEKELIKLIRMRIFERAKKSSDLEIMHWYTSLDDCFENDEFPLDEVNNIQWRVWVLFQKKELVKHLSELIEKLLKRHDLTLKEY